MTQDSPGAGNHPYIPKRWTVGELCSAASVIFDERIMEEFGYEVHFSNKGSDLKGDSLWRNRRVKRTIEQRCSVLLPDGTECEKSSKSSYGVCKEHLDFPVGYHPVDWVGYLVVPRGLLNELEMDIREAVLAHERLIVPMHGWLIERLLTWSGDDSERKKAVSTLMKSIEATVPSRVPDATSLQEMLLKPREQGGLDDSMNPSGICDHTKLLLDTAFPEDKFHGIMIPPCRFASRPKEKAVRRDVLELKPLSLDIRSMPVRVVAALTILAMIAEEANRGDGWFRARYGLGEPQMAGMHFAYTVYILRNEGRMNIKQITKVLQIPPWT